MKIIEVETKRKNILYGCWYGEQFDDTCLIMTNGTGGNIFENRFLRELGEFLQEKRVSYIYAHNSGAFQMLSNYGLSFEEFDDCVEDLSAFVDFAIKQGYENIILGGHSLGCNKVIYYLYKNHPSEIKKVVFVSPVDMIKKTNGELKSIEQIDAYLQVINLKDDEIVPIRYDNYNYYSKKSYLDVKNNKNQNNLPIYQSDKNFEQLQSINLPIYMIMGEKDIFAFGDTKKHLEVIKNNSNNAVYDIIRNTGHTFKNKISEFCDLIYKNI